MRKIDPKKLEAIKEAVYYLNENVGLSNLTTAQVAKEAQVSPGTIYLHFQTKTDLLSRLYEEAKAELHEGLAEAVKPDAPLETQVREALLFSVKQYQAHPEQANLVARLWTNPEMLDQEAIDYGQKSNPTLARIFNEIQASPAFIDASPATIELFLTLPTMAVQQNSKFNQDDVQQVIDLAIKSIKK